MTFTEVDARRANGHVQGIAGHFHRGDLTMYASLSDFPPGWGGCLIDTDRGRAGIEAMAMPQGRHPGGINVCDGILCVPVEHPDRYGRLYFYDLTHPLYPRQVGAFDESIFELDAATTDHKWVTHPGGKPEKASAAAMARMHLDWTFDHPDEHEEDHYLVAVLHENRYLRFFPVDRHLDGRINPTPLDGDDHRPITLDGATAKRWPFRSGWWYRQRNMVDNMSLLNTTDGLRLVVFSTHNLIPLLRMQLKFPFRRPRTEDRITVYTVSFPLDPETGERSVELGDPVVGRMDWGPDDGGRRRASEWCWPGFRWGASLTWDTGSQRFALFAAEFFGDEHNRRADDVVARERLGGDRAHAPNLPPEVDGVFDGPVQYLQFATNLDNPHFGRHDPDQDLGLPSKSTAVLRTVSDAIPALTALFKHWRREH